MLLVLSIGIVAGCQSPDGDAGFGNPANDTVHVSAAEIRGTFIGRRPGLHVIYTFLKGGAGLATISASQGLEPPPAPIGTDADEEVVMLIPTVEFSWSFTPPHLLIVDIHWSDDVPERHYLRAEKSSEGQLHLVEMTAPDGPDADLTFQFSHVIMEGDQD